MVEVELVMSAYSDKYVQLMKHEQNKDLMLLEKQKLIFKFDKIKIYLPVLVCCGGGGNVGLGSFIIVEGGGGGGGGTNCKSCCTVGKSCVEGGILVVSTPCVVGIFGIGN